MNQMKEERDRLLDARAAEENESALVMSPLDQLRAENADLRKMQEDHRAQVEAAEQQRRFDLNTHAQIQQQLRSDVREARAALQLCREMYDQLLHVVAASTTDRKHA